MSILAERLRAILPSVVDDMRAAREVQDREIGERHAAERVALDARHGAEFDALNITRAAEDDVVQQITTGLARFPD